MAQFKVPVSFEIIGDFVVEANSIEEAIQKTKKNVGTFNREDITWNLLDVFEDWNIPIKADVTVLSDIATEL
jgi:hypothetical protein